MTTSAQDKLLLPIELPSVAPDQDSAPAQVDNLAFARLCGEPLSKLPQDLYILPDAFKAFLEAFEGSLDLLLYLIRRQDFNVLNTPLAQVIRQYLTYTEQIHTTNLELAAEYPLMAVMLTEIKPRVLLPVKKTNSGDGPEDPHAGLVCRLLEHKQMKLTVQKLNTVLQLGRGFLCAQVYIGQSLALCHPDVNSDDLRVAWADVLRRAKLTQHHEISHEELSVCEHMSQILRRPQHARFMEFIELFEEAIRSGRDIPIMAVNFIAIFELSRESLLEIAQIEPYVLIHVRLARSPAQFVRPDPGRII